MFILVMVDICNFGEFYVYLYRCEVMDGFILLYGVV